MGTWGKGIFQNDTACDLKIDLENMSVSDVPNWISKQIQYALDKSSDGWHQDDTSNFWREPKFLEEFGISLSVAAAIVDAVLNDVTHVGVGIVETIMLDGEVIGEHMTKLIEEHREWVTSLRVWKSDVVCLEEDLIKALKVLISEDSCLAIGWKDEEWKEQFKQMIERFKQ